MTPYSREKLQKSLGYMESKIVQCQVSDLNSLGVKELCSNKRIKPPSTKQLQGPRTLDRAYIEEEKARIAAAAALAAKKAAEQEIPMLAKEQNAKETQERAGVSKKSRESTKATRGRGGTKTSRSRTSKQAKYEAEGADLRRLEIAMSFLTLCGMYSISKAQSIVRY